MKKIVIGIIMGIIVIISTATLSYAAMNDMSIPEVIRTFLRYEFKTVKEIPEVVIEPSEIITTQEGSILFEPVNVKSGWLFELAGGSDLEVTLGTLEYDEGMLLEKYIHIKGVNGEVRLLHNSASYENEYEKTLYWSAKQQEGASIVKGSTGDIQCVVLYKHREGGYSLYGYIEGDGTDFWSLEMPETGYYQPKRQNELSDSPVEGEINLMLSRTELGTEYYYYVSKDQQMKDLLSKIEWDQVKGFPKNTEKTGVSIVSDKGCWELLRDGSFYYYIDTGIEAECFQGNQQELYQRILQVLQMDLNYEIFNVNQIENVISAEVTYNNIKANEGYKQKIEDKNQLKLLENILRNSKNTNGISACPFYEAMLTLEKEDGTLLKMRLASDSCNVFLVNGLCYEYKGSSEEVFRIFNQIPWGWKEDNTPKETSVNNVSAVSPNQKLCIESYGQNDTVTAGGLYPAEGIRLYDISTKKVLWEMQGYYDCSFLWSKNSRYVAISYMARTYGEVILVDAMNYKSIPLIIPQKIQDDLREYRPDPYYVAKEWITENEVIISYQYINQKENEVTGEFIFDLVTLKVKDKR